MLSVIVLAAVLSLGDPTPPEASSRYAPPGWRVAPTPAQVEKHYPKAASDARVGGKVVLRCQVQISGKLSACAVETENPAGQGFGEAALALAPTIRMSPAVIDGVPTAEWIRLPINFSVPASGALPGFDGTLRCYGLFAVHAKASPRDRRLAAGLAWTRRRATELSAFQPLSAAAFEAKLAAAVAATPAPEHAASTDDPCFDAFLE